MFSKIFFFVLLLCAGNALSSHYHGPTAHPVVLHNGYLADTHDVAAAKSAHLATLAHQSHGYGADHGYADSYSYGYSGDSGHGHHGDYRYHGPIAIPHVLHNGHIADTHEVATAKAAHYGAVATAKSHGGHGYSGDSGHGHHGDYRYHGPIAIPHVLHNGHIADTHEVAAAKAAHYAAVATAKSHGGYGHGYSGHYAGGYDHGSYSGAHHAHNVPYHGHVARPVVLKSGYLADTHEVAAAKAAHYAAVATAKSHGGYGHGYSGHYAGGYDHGSYSGAHYAHNIPYHGHVARPVVLKSGYLADTHEVAAAKEHHLHALHSSHSGHHYGIH